MVYGVEDENQQEKNIQKFIIYSVPLLSKKICTRQVRTNPKDTIDCRYLLMLNDNLIRCIKLLHNLVISIILQKENYENPKTSLDHSDIKESQKKN